MRIQPTESSFVLHSVDHGESSESILFLDSSDIMHCLIVQTVKQQWHDMAQLSSLHADHHHILKIILGEALGPSAPGPVGELTPDGRWIVGANVG